MKYQTPTPSSLQQIETENVYRLWREKFIVPLLLGILVFGGIALFPAIIASSSALIDGIFVSTYLLVGVVTVLSFSYTIRISVFLLSVFVLAFGELISLGVLGDSLFFFLALVVFSTMLHSPRAGIVSIGFSIVTYMLIGWLMLSGQFVTLNKFATPATIQDWISAIVALIMFGSVIIFGFRQLENQFSETQKNADVILKTLEEQSTTLERRVEERTVQLRRINEVGRAVSAILDVNDILPFAAKFIQFEFDFYYTAIYLTDSSGQWVELKEAIGEISKVLKERRIRHNIINSKNIVAQVIRSKAGQIINNQDLIKLENPMFPYTRSLIVVPLVVGDFALGVVEMHSSKEHEFLPQDLDAYQNMANGIAIAIENSRLYQEAQKSIAEMRATQRQYLESAWSAVTSEKSLNYAIGDNEESDQNILEIPLTLRRQIIGQVQAAGHVEWTTEQKNLIEAIAAQASLALENARLVENSQVTASQERLTNEIISKIWSAQNMDGILQTTVREIGRNLEAAEVEIEVSMEGLDNDE